VEDEDDQVVVHVHRLNPETAAYETVSIQRDRLVLAEPFPVGVDLGLGDATSV